MDINFFTGEIPSEIGAIEGLEVFLADFNNLSGSVSQEICDLRGVNLMVLGVDCLPDSTFPVDCACCTRCGGEPVEELPTLL